MAYNEPMRKALMIGSTVADILIRVDHLPSLEEDVNPLGQTISLGGCCYNVSHMLELTHVPYTLFSPVGNGIYGTFVRNALAGQGIEPLLSSNEDNGCCYCIVDKDGNRTFLAVHGAEYRFEPEWFDAIDSDAYTDVYVCGLEIEEPTGVHIVRFLKNQSHMNIFFAPSARIMHIQKDRMETIMDCHPIVHVNRREAEWYLQDREMMKKTDKAELSALAEKLFQRTGNTAIVTDGKNGAAAFDGIRCCYEPAYELEAVDGTGAGDSHIGTIMSCLMRGKDLEYAMKWANRIAAGVVSVTGAVLSREKYEDILKK